MQFLKHYNKVSKLFQLNTLIRKDIGSIVGVDIDGNLYYDNGKNKNKK